MTTNEILPWKKLTERFYKSGYRPMVNRLYQLPDGKELEFDIVNSGPTACCLPLTSDNQVIMTKQFRPGQEQIVLELPGGSVDPGEDPATGMSRELLEETGYQGELEFIGTSFSGAYDTLLRYNYIARNCIRIGEPKNDPGEPIEVVLISLEEFRKHIRSGQLNDALTGYLALDHLGKL